MSQPQKVLGLWDIHIGHEKTQSGGKWVLQKTWNPKAVTAVINFAKDWGPDVLVLGGDQLNAGSISHWNHGKPIMSEGLRLKDEMDTLDETVLTPLEATKSVKRKIWHTGNHEQWIADFIAGNPAIEGLVEPEVYLRLEERGYETYSQGEISKLGKINYVHGDAVLGRGTTVNPAKTLVNAYRRNIRAGHIHTYSAAIEQTAVDARDYHSGIIVPSLSIKNPYFVKGRPNCYMQGFYWGYVWPDGEFTDQVTIINNNQFTVGGRRYGKG